MQNTQIAFLGIIVLIVFIYLLLLFLRVRATISGKKRVNDFSPTGEDLGEFSRRLVRSHANIYEFFPVWGGILLYAMIAGQMAVTNPLALIFLAARILQSLIHIISTSIMAVQARFFLFMVQIIIAIYWLVKLSGLI